LLRRRALPAAELTAPSELDSKAPRSRLGGVGGLRRAKPKPIRRLASLWRDGYELCAIYPPDEETLVDEPSYPGAPPPPRRERENVRIGAGVSLLVLFFDEPHLPCEYCWVVVRARHGDLYEGAVLDTPSCLNWRDELFNRGKIVYFTAEHVRVIDPAEDRRGEILESFGPDFFEDGWVMRETS
jgi:hypothetical protein